MMKKNIAIMMGFLFVFVFVFSLSLTLATDARAGGDPPRDICCAELCPPPSTDTSFTGWIDKEQGYICNPDPEGAPINCEIFYYLC